MTNLRRAREIASLVRLPEDISSKLDSAEALKGRHNHRDNMLRHGVLISMSVTPGLEKGLAEVCETLQLPRSCITAFVYNSAEVQADCLIDSPDTCVLRFTSGLVNLMDENEFKFIIGHELGHFLLGHGACSQYQLEESSEAFIVRRARELSADRLGFLAIGNQEKSIQAIIKTASGLSEQFLRFDVASFMSQTNLISNPSKGESRNSTHPSMLIRCRSLLWFSMSIHSLDDLNGQYQSKIAEVDSRVLRDLEKYVDGQVRMRKIELEEDVTIWKSALLIFHSGSFAKDVQLRLSDQLGDETLNGLKSFFQLYQKEDLPKEIADRLNMSISAAYKEFPSSGKEIEETGIESAYKIVEGKVSN